MIYYTSSPPQSSSPPTQCEDSQPAADYDEEGRDVPSPSEYLGASSTAASTAPSSPTPIKPEDDYDSEFVKNEEVRGITTRFGVLLILHRQEFGVPEMRMNDRLDFVKDEAKEVR